MDDGNTAFWTHVHIVRYWQSTPGEHCAAGRGGTSHSLTIVCIFYCLAGLRVPSYGASFIFRPSKPSPGHLALGINLTSRIVLLVELYTSSVTGLSIDVCETRAGYHYKLHQRKEYCTVITFTNSIIRLGSVLATLFPLNFRI